MDNERIIIVNSDDSFEWRRKAPKAKKMPKALKTIASLILVAAISIGSAAAYIHFAGSGAEQAPLLSDGTATVIKQITGTASAGTAEARTGSGMSIPDIYAECVKSTVIFTVKIPSSNGYFFGFYGQQQQEQYDTAFGSGVIMSADGYILTCAHVVDGASEITVKMYDDTEYKATVVGSDANTDIAVVKINATGLHAATFGDSSALLVGEEAYAIGNPLSSELAFTLTCGHISALQREIDIQGTVMELMQVDAAINPGNSGGPLIDSRGNVIGIVNAKIASTDIEGLGFAVPVNKVLSIARSLMDYGYVAGRPMLGITIQSATAQQARLYGLQEGIYVTEVSPGSCAETGGVKVGDRITHFNGVAVKTSAELNYQKEKYKVGDKVTITVLREDKTLVLNITLAN